jgi:hypothetical protein
MVVLAAAQIADHGRLAMKKLSLFLALGFALFAAPAAVIIYPQSAIPE